MVGRGSRIALVAERFRLFNSTNVSPISQVFGSGMTPFPDLGKSLAGTGSHQIHFSLDFEF